LTLVCEALESRQKLSANVKTQKKRHAVERDLDEVEQLTLRAVYLDLASAVDHELQLAVLPEWIEENKRDWESLRAKRPPPSSIAVVNRWEREVRKALFRSDVTFLTFPSMSGLFKRRFGVELASLTRAREAEQMRKAVNIFKHRRGFLRPDWEPPKIRLGIKRTYQLISKIESFILAVREIRESSEVPANGLQPTAGNLITAPPRLKPRRQADHRAQGRAPGAVQAEQKGRRNR
jgi:hypothetical protein